MESWFHQSRDDLNLMRATTTLTLTRSDGYALFSDPNTLPAPDHLHDWYDFWDADLGVPTAPGEARQDGSVIRSFTNGVVIYNPLGNETVNVSFPESMQSVATGLSGTQHKVASAAGDIFLNPPLIGSKQN